MSRTSGSPHPNEYTFDQESIIIGRDSASHLALPDPQRVVSKRHAEIRCQNDTVQLLDLGSKNFTYLNERKLQPGIPYELHGGDAIRVGEFEILYEPVLRAEADYDRTIFDASFVNPFEEDAERLAAAWRGIRETFERESPTRRVDALAEALAQAGVQVDGGEADEILARIAGFAGEEVPSGAVPRAEGSYATPVPQPRPLPVADPLKLPATPGLNAGRRAPAMAGQLEPVGDRLFNVLAKAFAKVTSTPWQFRHEFIGQTVVQTPDHAAIYSGDPNTLKDFLLDASIPAEETERRFAVVEALADDVVLHQFGMLDGYRSSVQEGSRILLEEVDPEVVENTVRQGGAVYRWFALLRKAKVFDLLVARRRELQGEDWSVSERRIFRPAFIRSYLARVATGHH